NLAFLQPANDSTMCVKSYLWRRSREYDGHDRQHLGSYRGQHRQQLGPPREFSASMLMLDVLMTEAMTAPLGLTTGAMMMPSLVTARPRCNSVECCDGSCHYRDFARRWRDDRGTRTLRSSTENQPAIGQHSRRGAVFGAATRSRKRLQPFAGEVVTKRVIHVRH